ncbi:MAG: right-handed parallel beta-helix repeat-containing protein, partial [Luteolibacter sp.]
MTPLDARKILGLDPDEDPRPHLSEFKEARERIAELVRSAPNTALADRYQKGLIEFDQALAAIQEHLQATGLAAPPLPKMTIAEEAPQTAPTPQPDSADSSLLLEVESAPRKARSLSIFAWLLILLIAIAGSGWIFLQYEQSKKEQRQTRIAFLEGYGSTFIENRRWPEATAAFAEIESLAPGSPIALLGRRSIEAGMAEEQTQFIGYWTGQALTELETGRLAEATSAARQVLDKFPGNAEAASILNRISAARTSQSRTDTLTAARALLDQRKWQDAIQTANAILATTPDDPDAKTIIADATAALEKASANQARAATLLKNALAREQGQFDQTALEWLREAKSLDPENPQISAQLEKLAKYTRTFHVPGDFATPQEALDQAHDQDRIILAAQTWKGPLSVDVAVDLQSDDPTKTTVECPAESGSAITIGPDAKGARISGITFRHESFAGGSERFSVALVRGGSATFVDCRFTDASGHGLVVIEKGHATAEQCRFANNGWNGVSVIGAGSTLEVKDSESINNFEHGIESWDGAAIALANNRCEGNSRNGIHVDNGQAAATLTGNQLIANREFGLVLDSAGSGKVSGNIARANLLGGLVIRAAAVKLPVTGNQATLNQGPGLVLEKGLSPAAYTDNAISQNATRQTLTDADLSQHEDLSPTHGKSPNGIQEETPPAAIIVEPAPKKR